MPVHFDIPDMRQVRLARALRQYRATVLQSKRPRKAVSYADGLLQRAAEKRPIKRGA